MSAIKVEELPEGRTSAMNRLYQRTYARTFRVECDDPLDGPVVIRRDAPGLTPVLPGVGNYYHVSSAEEDKGAFCDNASYAWVDKTMNGCIWNVTLTYSPYDALTFGPNPLDWPVVYWFEAENRDLVVTEDVNGVPIQNAAKEPFAEPVAIDDHQRILYVERREAVAAYDDQFADGFRNTRNNAVWNGWDVHVVRCASIKSGKPEYDSVAQIWYFTVLYKFVIDAKYLHNRIILNTGYSYLDTSSPPKQVRITGPDGQPLPEPSKLDSSGHVLATSASPFLLTFEVIPAIDFTPFRIDLSKAVGR